MLRFTRVGIDPSAITIGGPPVKSKAAADFHAAAWGNLVSTSKGKGDM